MKNVCIIFLLSIIISLTALGAAFGANSGNTVNSEFLRIHIRADSNESSAQAVKYLVRDKIVEELTPYVATFETSEEAACGVQALLPQIERTAQLVLEKNGFCYGARASVKTEKFPTRIYGEYTLPAGEYTALIIELGEGAGDNWWCVIYPPLCFSSPSGGKIVYKSKIIEIIETWKKNRKG